MATYKEIQAYVHKKYGYVPQTCWIAHVKELNGLPVRRAPNRRGNVREKPCPADKQNDIRDALEHFKMLNDDTGYLEVIRLATTEIPGLPSYEPRQAVAAMEEDRHQRLVRLMERSIVYSYKHPTERQEWLFSPTSEFRKSVRQLDKKLQGRILEAITDICSTPTEARGDTIKPLTGELKGKWRYRIGDYRLIYLPDEQAHIVYLLAMFARGSAYVD